LELVFFKFFGCIETLFPLRWKFIKMCNAGSFNNSRQIIIDSCFTVIQNGFFTIQKKKTSAVELGSIQIISNHKIPNSYKNKMVLNTYKKSANENCVYLADRIASLFETIPVSRFGGPEEVASEVDLFAFDEAGFINCQTTNVDIFRVFFNRKEAANIH
jgi:hypothetical protein